MAKPKNLWEKTPIAYKVIKLNIKQNTENRI